MSGCIAFIVIAVIVMIRGCDCSRTAVEQIAQSGQYAAGPAIISSIPITIPVPIEHTKIEIRKVTATKLVYVTKQADGSLTDSAREAFKEFFATPDTDAVFIAELDTLLPPKNDTLRVQYEHPAAKFSILFRPVPDTTKVVTQMLTVTVVKDIPWYERPLYILGGAAIGFGIGVVTQHK